MDFNGEVSTCMEWVMVSCITLFAVGNMGVLIKRACAHDDTNEL